MESITKYSKDEAVVNIGSECTIMPVNIGKLALAVSGFLPFLICLYFLFNNAFKV